MALELDFMPSYDSASVAEEIQRIAKLTGKQTVSSEEINKHGRLCSGTVIKIFGSMAKANEIAGLVPRQQCWKWSTEQMLAAIGDLWLKTLAEKGRSPIASDLKAYGCALHHDAICKRFGSWRRALVAASAASGAATPAIAPVPRPARRPVSSRMRFIVFKRDKYTCRICLKSGGELEIDHIIPVSKGGSEMIDNLQTACYTCNRGKRDSLQ